METNYLGVLYVIEALIRDGLIGKDPEDSTRVLVCRVQEAGKEQWYSENVFELATETYKNKASLRALLKEAKAWGIDTEACMERGWNVIESTGKLLQLFGGCVV